MDQKIYLVLFWFSFFVDFIICLPRSRHRQFVSPSPLHAGSVQGLVLTCRVRRPCLNRVESKATVSSTPSFKCALSVSQSAIVLHILLSSIVIFTVIALFNLITACFFHQSLPRPFYTIFSTSSHPYSVCLFNASVYHSFKSFTCINYGTVHLVLLRKVWIPSKDLIPWELNWPCLF